MGFRKLRDPCAYPCIFHDTFSPAYEGWDLDIMVLNRIELGKRSLTDFGIQKILDVLGRKWADLDERAPCLTNQMASDFFGAG
jgi:hypothetical protein